MKEKRPTQKARILEVLSDARWTPAELFWNLSPPIRDVRRRLCDLTEQDGHVIETRHRPRTPDDESDRRSWVDRRLATHDGPILRAIELALTALSTPELPAPWVAPFLSGVTDLARHSFPETSKAIGKDRESLFETVGVEITLRRSIPVELDREAQTTLVVAVEPIVTREIRLRDDLVTMVGGELVDVKLGARAIFDDYIDSGIPNG